MKKTKKKISRLDRIEECILDLALAIESGRIDMIYQDCGAKLFPLPTSKKNNK